MSDATIRAWLDRGREYPTPAGQQGWVAHRDELMALLAECTPRVPLSVIPKHHNDDTTTFYIQLSVMFSRSELVTEAHADLPITEDADGLTCDICGSELADWAAADHHNDKEHPS